MSNTRLFHRLISITLCYPDEELLHQIPTLGQALANVQPEKPGLFARSSKNERAAKQVEAKERIGQFLEYLKTTPTDVLELSYVQTFDLSRKHALYLSYWTDGDTRRRGEVLAAFKQAYRTSDFLVDTQGELPDFLPMVLEYAAIADPAGGLKLMGEYRASIELLRLALEEAKSPYALLLQALSATLPGPSVHDRDQAMALAGHGPPTESVGLEPFNRELLPVRSL
ncbi:nitrate reductase molybdenum cofactor assembly chaperone [Arthrobacter sp. MYb227]|uniref:nitrate reductase molybdenum cofactor assembly chaperone n=1 Tax=Arthrobacter sp. MYb227 TaxID=1848601 RepID=UPI000CFCE1E7|nr:nitrate reductase molybdenum cofactor assembly chaperone [Arthrobacter sp. MYb227]PQZ96120.1 nitrate reductase molybdenum cofactor assembly chaperone [Arthrobacter sp. MYb227]